MKKLFVHQPLFRLLSPLFSGTLVYLLILLINNNIAQLQDSFLGQELYVCIGLAYLIQEYARLSLLGFEKLSWPKSFALRLILQIVISIIIGMILVSMAMYVYFTNVLGYVPNSRELWIFNSIFSIITLIYLVLYLSHQFLYKVNTNRLAKEILAKEEVETDFTNFKKGVNPELLFECLESLIVLMKRDPERAENLSDKFSSVYRYVLAKKNREIVSFSEELKVLGELIQLFAHLPYRKVKLAKVEVSETSIVPGSVLAIVERIIKSTIPSDKEFLDLRFTESGESIFIQYEPEETLRGKLEDEQLEDISRNYGFYSVRSVLVYMKGRQKTVQLPKLNLHESSHH